MECGNAGHKCPLLRGRVRRYRGDWRVKKAAKKPQGHRLLGDQSDSDAGAQIFQLLEPRLELGHALAAQAQDYLSESGVGKQVTELREQIAYPPKVEKQGQVRSRLKLPE